MTPLTLSATTLRLFGIYNLYHLVEDENYVLRMFRDPSWHLGHYYVGMMLFRLLIAVIAIRGALPISKAITVDFPEANKKD